MIFEIYLQKCDGECVPFYLCKNNTVISDGTGVIDLRFGEEEEEPLCYDYLETCCETHNRVKESLITPIHFKHGCGYRHVTGVGFRIKGNDDNESEYGEFPWMIAVLRTEIKHSKSTNVYVSGGSLIHQKVVLTVAHFFDDGKVDDLFVRAGEWDTQTQNELYPTQDSHVKEIIIHEKFNKNNAQNDIALLILKEEFILSGHINIICLPPPKVNFDYKRCIASGWGKDSFGREGKYQVILKRVELPVIPHEKCEKLFRSTRLGKRFNLHESFICAGGEKGKDTCTGDGGSPLVCPIPNTIDRYYQAGIVAWGVGCFRPIPGVYVDVAKFKPWIDENMDYLSLEKSFYTPQYH